MVACAGPERAAQGRAQVTSYPGVDHDMPRDWGLFASDLNRFYVAASVMTATSPIETTGELSRSVTEPST
ncbi:MAG: hypothetical protein JWO33_309 [Caulobacteraceae bacterium]|nr:hypothetical protein [Caulobacteraceae bacterium]